MQDICFYENVGECVGQYRAGRGALGSLSPSVSFSSIFLRLIAAPALTSLQIASNAATGDLKRLFTAIFAFPELKMLEIDLTFSRASSQLIQSQIGLSACASLKSAKLQSAKCPLSPMLVAIAILKSAPGLEELSVGTCLVCQEHDQKVSTGDMVIAWAVLLPAVRRCTSLKRLHLGNLSGVHEGQFEKHSQELAATLAALKNLTWLHLSAEYEGVFPGRCELHGKHLAPALTRLTELRELTIRGGAEELALNDAKEVVEACKRLGQLSDLSLCVDADDSMEIPELIAELRELKQLMLCEDFVASAWLRSQ